jgi:endoglucanase
MRPADRGRRLVWVALLAAGLLACDPAPTRDADAPAGSAGPTTSASVVSPGQPDADVRELWLNPDGHGPLAVREARAQGRDDVVEALEPLAAQPTATWITTPGDPYVEVERLSRAAAAAGELPVLVAYHAPVRDCRQYSAGGAANIDEYLHWIGSFAAGLADRPALVVLEPDAIPQAVTGCEGLDPAQRYELLFQAVAILDRQPRTRIYLDAGNPRWIGDVAALATALRRSNVHSADGFSLNVANFVPTEEVATFGLALSQELERGAPAGAPPAHFVIDTSRNGAGPLPADEDDPERWCNPPGRRLGQPPTTSPGLPRVDALLWIKQPGDSDGTCRGGPPAGSWWPEMAADLVRR